MTKIINNSILKDVLSYLTDSSSSTEEKNKGIVIGIVSTLMAQGKTFGQAITVVAEYLPKVYNDNFPAPWAFDINSAANKLGKVPNVHPALRRNK